MTIIQLQNIFKRYQNQIVLQDVNLEIPSGAFVVLHGESGAGKSTLLNLIGGLEKPTSGRIIVDDRDIAQLTSADRTNFYRREIDIAFQGAYLHSWPSL